MFFLGKITMKRQTAAKIYGRLRMVISGYVRRITS